MRGILTSVPSAAAVSRSLFLGNPAGSLADGTLLWSESVQNSHSLNSLEWYKNGITVELSSDDLALPRLKAIASNVTVG
jgi:hypothetical protein